MVQGASKWNGMECNTNVSLPVNTYIYIYVNKTVQRRCGQLWSMQPTALAHNMPRRRNPGMSAVIGEVQSSVAEGSELQWLIFIFMRILLWVLISAKWRSVARSEESGSVIRV